jgi:tRNA G26 N,N-dimethylase Trm1
MAAKLRAIEPLMSSHIDNYFRVFVNPSAAMMKEASSKILMPWV